MNSYKNDSKMANTDHFLTLYIIGIEFDSQLKQIDFLIQSDSTVH